MVLCLRLAASLSAAFGIDLGDDLVEAAASFTELTPSAYVADLVLVGPLAAVVVEVQTAPSDTKRLRWPLEGPRSVSRALDASGTFCTCERCERA